MTSVLVAMHQPHYHPWLGYMEKLGRADLFVFVDHVQFERKGWQNRNYVKSGHGPVRLTVPVVQRARSETIAEKRIDGSKPWRERHRRTITDAYGRAPYWAEYRDIVDELYSRDWERLCDLNVECVLRFARALGLDAPVVRTSELGPIRGAKSSMIVSIAKLVGADAFLSGDGSTYLEERVFKEAGIELVWQRFEHPVYRQLHMRQGFIPRMSALDLLLNEGRAGADLLRGRAAGVNQTATPAAAEPAQATTIRSRRPVFDASALDETLSLALRALASGRLIGGPNAERLEASLGRAWRRPAVATRSGMDALALVFESVAVRGRDVLIPANCFPNVAALVCDMGARAVPVDVDHVSLAMLEGDLGGQDMRGALAVWVHHCGMVAADAAGAITRLRAAGCFVIEDCAYLVPPVKPDGPGAWGDATVLSFAATKPVPAGTGGALLCADPQLAAVAAARRPHGGQEARWREGDRFGHDRRLDEIAAAIALHQWGRVDTIRARLAAVGQTYIEALDRVCPRVLVVGRRPEPTWSKFPIQLPPEAPDAMETLAWLGARGIEASAMYERPWPDYPWFARHANAVCDCRDWSRLRDLLSRNLCLPYHERLTGPDIVAVAGALAELRGA